MLSRFACCFHDVFSAIVLLWAGWGCQAHYGLRLDDCPIAAGADPAYNLRDHLAARSVLAGIDVDAEVQELFVVETFRSPQIIQRLDQFARVLQTQLRFVIQLLAHVGYPADVLNVVEEDSAVTNIMERNHDHDLRGIEVLRVRSDHNIVLVIGFRRLLRDNPRNVLDADVSVGMTLHGCAPFPLRFGRSVPIRTGIHGFGDRHSTLELHSYVEPQGGLEPPTYGLEGRCPVQLGDWGMWQPRAESNH